MGSRKQQNTKVKATTGAPTANVTVQANKVTMILSDDDLENVSKLRRQLRKASNSGTVGSALNIAEIVVRALETGEDLYVKEKDGTWSRLKLTA